MFCGRARERKIVDGREKGWAGYYGMGRERGREKEKEERMGKRSSRY